VLTLVLIVLVVLILLGGVGWARYPAWSTGVYGAPDVVSLLVVVLLALLLLYLARVI
jgi:hypothetical protein